jgi:hypothetical protein
MMNKKMLFRKEFLVALAILAVFLVKSPYAASSALAGVCSFPSSPANYSSFDGLITDSFLIIAVMLLIIAMIFAFGQAIRNRKLIEYGKHELGEIGITILVVIILVGGFAGISTFAAPPALAAVGVSYSSAIFASDCSQITAPSGALLGYATDIVLGLDVAQMVSSFEISIEPQYFGISFSPFAGLSAAIQPIGNLLSFLGVLLGLTIGLGVFLGILYAIMPLFLFAGIILRTMPWTRAAGGAFIGFFIGFFILFPLLLGFTLAYLPSSGSTSNPSPKSFTPLQFTNINPSAAFTIVQAALDTVNPTQSIELLVQTIASNAYVLIGVVLSLIISFDFADIMGDLLGSPSLSSSASLKKVI